jgi:hypothetical protein
MKLALVMLVAPIVVGWLDCVARVRALGALALRVLPRGWGPAGAGGVGKELVTALVTGLPVRLPLVTRWQSNGRGPKGSRDHSTWPARE